MAEVEKDDLLGEIAAAYDGLEDGAGTPETPAKAPPAETAEQAADRVRDEQGRFAKSEEGRGKPKDVSRETLTLKDKKSPESPQAAPPVPQEQAAAAAPTPAAAPGTPKDEPIAPPSEWKGAGKVQWNKLPKAIQSELRETYESLSQSREAMAPLEQAIAPYRDEWTRVAGSPASAISQLGEFYKLYVENPVGLIQHIARTRGIDLGGGQGQPPAQGGTPPAAPDINSLIRQAVQQEVAPIQQHFKQTADQQLDSIIQSFAADPRYPYFNDVKVQMGQLMEAGIVPMGNMAAAYDKAVKLNDAIQAQIQASKAEEAKGNQTAEAEKARRAAAASLRGSPLPNGHAGGGAGSGASVLDDVRAAAAELSGS